MPLICVRAAGNVEVRGDVPLDAVVKAGLDGFWMFRSSGVIGIAVASAADVEAGILHWSPVEEMDVRILRPRFEKDQTRFVSLVDVQPDYVEDDMEDWPVRGERVLVNSARSLKREQKSWLSHHEGWMMKSGVRKSDRSVQEHRVPCQSLH